MIYRNDFETMYSEGSCNLSANGFLKYFKKMMLNTMTDEDESFLKNIIADGYDTKDFEYSATYDEDGLEINFSWEENQGLCYYRGECCREYEAHSITYYLRPSEDDTQEFEYDVTADAHYSIYATIDEDEVDDEI